jgi:hypothetical protein
LPEVVIEVQLPLCFKSPASAGDFLMMQLGVVYKFVVDGNCASTANWDSSLVRRIPCPKWLFDVGTQGEVQFD